MPGCHGHRIDTRSRRDQSIAAPSRALPKNAAHAYFFSGIRNWLATGLLLSQFLLVAGYEWHALAKPAATTEPVGASLAAVAATISPWILCDQLSVIMVLIIGIIGGLICIYAPGYMKEFHTTHHPDMRDRRPMFFATVFVFLGAMFGLVCANNLNWLSTVPKILN